MKKKSIVLSAVQSVCYGCAKANRPYCRSGCSELRDEKALREKERQYRAAGRDPPLTAAAVARRRKAIKYPTRRKHGGT